jgi:glyoxylase-like metal-dependent hydrolase (beta-lactamase superfamily II)
MAIKERHFGPIWFIPGENNGKYPFCHSIYIEGPGILIDPASNRQRLRELKKKPGVNTIWLSHYHEDHFMHLDLFDDLPLMVSREDALPLSDIERFLDAYGVEAGARDEWRSLVTDVFHFHPRKPFAFLPVGSSLSFGSVQVDILPAPGHTPGSVALHFPKHGILFLADYDLTPFGPWYGDVASSIDATISTVTMLERMPASTWLTSHEQGVFESPPGPLWQSYLDVIHEREAKLLTLLDKPCSIQDVVNAWIVYRKPREPLSFYTFTEKALMTKHLERLTHQGVVKHDDGRYVRVA